MFLVKNLELRQFLRQTKNVVNNTPSRPVLPLEPNLVDTDVMYEFDLEPYMDDSMPQSSDVDASPAHVFRGFW
jgi:hypothetical protein